MVTTHNLGFPRIGLHREMKFAVEAYWKREIDENKLQEIQQELCTNRWHKQKELGLDLISVGDFSWYDHVLDTSLLLGVIPTRFQETSNEVTLDTYFRMARGRSAKGADIFACEMTKWFDTNYHYIVPELTAAQSFKIMNEKIFDEIKLALKLGHAIKPVLLGPLTFLWLSKTVESQFNKLSLLPSLLSVYQEILTRTKNLGIEWIQIDEPILVLDLPSEWQTAFQQVYTVLQIKDLKLLLTTYFGGLRDNLKITCQLPVAGIHIDTVRDANQLEDIFPLLQKDTVLSIGIIDGRNVWRADLTKIIELLKPMHKKLGERLWIAPSCSLLHCPIDLATEINLDMEVKSWLAFAIQKIEELVLIAKGLKEGSDLIKYQLAENKSALLQRKTSTRIHNSIVKESCANVSKEMLRRNVPFSERHKLQQQILNLPLFPTTTIGSLPQTKEIRALRQRVKKAEITQEQYKTAIRQIISAAIKAQDQIGLDVLVHGEFERSDMVEYFAELLTGFTFTENGWVQSYGSRCVKPPIIYGDVVRDKPMTIEWIRYAQTLTDKPVKGMLTGPMTILSWSFVRDDQSRYETAKQLALALRAEMIDLEHAGIKIIQIDEPAFREGLPLHRSDWPKYLKHAVNYFRLATSGVKAETQVHTHMCYSEFNDIIFTIAELDADVITIESSRSRMELLKAFEDFQYPNDIGPGIYDIHSPRIPTVQEIINLLTKAAIYIPRERLWVNPDCGLKTREWSEIVPVLINMVQAARFLRGQSEKIVNSKEVT